MLEGAVRTALFGAICFSHDSGSIPRLDAFFPLTANPLRHLCIGRRGAPPVPLFAPTAYLRLPLAQHSTPIRFDRAAGHSPTNAAPPRAPPVSLS